jgi:hypothetical protein
MDFEKQFLVNPGSEEKDLPLGSEEKGFKPLTREDVEDHDVPGAEEILEIMAKEVSERDRERIKMEAAKIPLGLKAEIVKIFKEQVDLFKSLGKGLKERINWDSKKKRAVVCLGLYALMNVMGGVLHASESDSESDSHNDFDGDIDSNFIKSTLSNAFYELESINITEDAKNLFFNNSMDLAKGMLGRGVEKMRYEYVVDRMLQFSKYVQESNGSLEQLQRGLNEISSNYLEHLDNLEKHKNQIDSNDSDISIESNNKSISDEIVLPEGLKLEFNSHFSESEKMNIQKYYDATIKEIYAAADKFEWWGEEYGDKENFSDFEKLTKDYIINLIDITKNIEDNANNPDFNVKTFVNSVGNNPEKVLAEETLKAIAAKANLRTAEEEMEDAFKELKDTLN